VTGLLVVDVKCMMKRSGFSQCALYSMKPWRESLYRWSMDQVKGHCLRWNTSKSRWCIEVKGLVSYTEIGIGDVVTVELGSEKLLGRYLMKCVFYSQFSGTMISAPLTICDLGACNTIQW
jgi:hypothetical protein